MKCINYVTINIILIILFVNMVKIIKKILDSMTKERKGFVIQSIDFSNILKLTNKKFLINTYLFIAILILTTSITIYTLPDFFFIDYLSNYIFYALIFLSLILVYLIIFQFNYYIINIDKHFIDIKIYRTVISTTNAKNHIYLRNETLKDFSFLNSSFTFNKTLILKINTDKREIKTIKLNLLYLSKKEEHRIKKFLNRIININNFSE
jgi:hypothetical protein